MSGSVIQQLADVANVNADSDEEPVENDDRQPSTGGTNNASAEDKDFDNTSGDIPEKSSTNDDFD